MAQFGGLAGCLPPHYGSGFGVAEEQAQAIGLLSVSAAAGNNKAAGYLDGLYNCAAGVASAAQSELTCNGAGGVVLPSRKRGRDYAEHEPHVPTRLPIPVTHTHWSTVGAAAADRLAESSSATASTSGRPVPGSYAAEVNALVRADCDGLRAGIDRAAKRQRLALARAAAFALREKEAALDAARCRAASLEELLRRAAAESRAWRGVARSTEAAASGLRATLDAVLLRGAGGATAEEVEEGFGESGHAAADDAASCCFVEKAEDAGHGASSPARACRCACRACGAGEATVLVLPCRHLCLCKACEPRADACPVCCGAKNASIHVAAPH